MEKKEKEIQENILKSYEEPTLIGLNNIGASCYINSILQCLSQTPPLVNYFLNDSNKGEIMNNNINKENENKPQISPVFLKLIKILWDKNKKGSSFSPYDFMETIEKINPLLKKGSVAKSRDFFIIIIEQIHKELNKPINFQSQAFNLPLNQYDRNNAFEFFIKDAQKECSIISDNFYGINQTTNICLYCKNLFSSKGQNYPIAYNYGIFNCIIFPLPEVKSFANNYRSNIDNQINQNNSVTLNDCFCYNQQTETFTGDNANYCNICKKLNDSEYTFRIYLSPNILILILDRGKNNEYKIRVEFTETLDITQFVIEKDRPQIIYNLYGVIAYVSKMTQILIILAFVKVLLIINGINIMIQLLALLKMFKKKLLILILQIYYFIIKSKKFKIIIDRSNCNQTPLNIYKKEY